MCNKSIRTYSNTVSLLGKLVALMVTELGDTMMKIIESSVSQTKSPGNFQSPNTWSRHVTHSFRPSQNSSSRTKATQRVCFNYNSGAKCKYSPFYFKHISQHCSEQHPRIKCSRPDKGKTGSRPASGNNIKV